MKTSTIRDHGHERKIYSSNDITPWLYKPSTPVLNGASISSGLVLAMPYYEGTGGTVHDLSTTPDNGTVNTGMWVTDTTYTNVIKWLSGYSQSTPNASKLNTETYTFAIAIKSSSATTSYIAAKGGYTQPCPLIVQFAGTLKLSAESPAASPYAITSGSYADGAWHKLVFTRAQGGALNIFVDGIFRATATDTTAASSTLNTATFNVPPNNSFPGEIAYCHLWNRVLSGVPGSTGSAATGEIATITADEFAMYR